MTGIGAHKASVPPEERGLLFAVIGPFACGYFLSYLLRNVNAVISPDLVRTFHLDASDLGLLTHMMLVGSRGSEASEMERPHQIGRDDGVDVPKQIGEEIAAGKGSDDRRGAGRVTRVEPEVLCAPIPVSVRVFRWWRSGRNRTFSRRRFFPVASNLSFRGPPNVAC